MTSLQCCSLVSSPSHSTVRSLPVLLPFTLTLTLPPMSLSCILTLTLPVLLLTGSHPHRHPPSLCCSLIPLPSPSLPVLFPHTLALTLQYIGTLCIHFFPQPLCMYASPNVPSSPFPFLIHYLFLPLSYQSTILISSLPTGRSLVP